MPTESNENSRLRELIHEELRPVAEYGNDDIGEYLEEACDSLVNVFEQERLQSQIEILKTVDEQLTYELNPYEEMNSEYYEGMEIVKGWKVELEQKLKTLKGEQ